MEENNLILYAPEGFNELTKEEKSKICNGCGAKGGLPVPNTFWGLDISMACNIHDYMYSKGKTLKDKDTADRVFKNNCFRIINYESCCNLLKKLRLIRANTYYLVVKNWGGDAFFAGKNKKSEEVIV
jgi:hypothetical protein